MECGRSWSWQCGSEFIELMLRWLSEPVLKMVHSKLWLKLFIVNVILTSWLYFLGFFMLLHLRGIWLLINACFSLWGCYYFLYIVRRRFFCCLENGCFCVCWFLEKMNLIVEPNLVLIVFEYECSLKWKKRKEKKRIIFWLYVKWKVECLFCYLFLCSIDLWHLVYMLDFWWWDWWWSISFFLALVITNLHPYKSI